MIKRLIMLAVMLPVFAFAAQQSPLPIESCATQAVYGFPHSNKRTTAIICRQGYVVEYDRLAHVPVWVAYELTPAHALGCIPRSNKFAADQSVEETSRPSQYAKSHYDMGHFANADDMRWDVQVEEDSFITTNMAPQLPGFNRGIWKKLEDQVRAWVLERQHPIQVYIASVYNKQQDPTLPRTDITIPHGFVKVVIDTVTHETLAFYFDNASSTNELQTFSINVYRAQQLTGVTFPLPSAPVNGTWWPAAHKSAKAYKQCNVPGNR